MYKGRLSPGSNNPGFSNCSILKSPNLNLDPISQLGLIQDRKNPRMENRMGDVSPKNEKTVLIGHNLLKKNDNQSPDTQVYAP